MARPVTLFSGQWADLPFALLCQKARSFGFDGIELACQGDQMDARRSATDSRYVEEKKAVLREHKLQVFALGGHLAGQCVGDQWDPRLDAFAPPEAKGNPEKIRAWATQEMKYIARAAKAMGVSVVTGFLGSPAWRYWYAWPPTSEQMVEDAFQEIVRLWTPIFDEFDACGVRFALEVHPTEIDFDEIIRALNAVGYQGPLSVEWEDSGMDREAGAREALEFVRRVDFAPSSVAFDAAMKK